jgi:hypothetical protein
LDGLISSQRIHPHLYVSAEVYGEVVITGAGLPGAMEVAKAEWIEVKPLQQSASLAAAQAQLSL